MSIGTGLAIAGIWGAVSYVATRKEMDQTTVRLGFLFALFATFVIAMWAGMAA